MFDKNHFGEAKALARFINFLNRQRRKIYLLWISGGFVLWAWLGYTSYKANTDNIGGIFLYISFFCWLFFHVSTAVIFAICLAFWRWRLRKVEA